MLTGAIFKNKFLRPVIGAGAAPSRFHSAARLVSRFENNSLCHPWWPVWYRTVCMRPNQLSSLSSEQNVARVRKSGLVSCLDTKLGRKISSGTERWAEPKVNLIDSEAPLFSVRPTSKGASLAELTRNVFKAGVF